MKPVAALKLRPLNVPNLTEPIEVSEEGVSIGRDPGNQVVLVTDHFPFISAVHARLEVKGGELFLEDLASKNGTLVNGKRIQERVRLRGGDVIQFGRESGATFAVIADASATQTLVLKKPPQPEVSAEFSRTTIFRLKEALGLPDQPQDPGEPRRHRPSTVTLLLFCLLALGIGTTIYLIIDTQRSVNEAVEKSLARASRRIANQEEQHTQQLVAYNERQSELERRAHELRALVIEMESTGQGNVDNLRTQLEETNAKLEQYNPLEIERIEQERLKDVLGSIVYIETRVAYREKEGTRYLHENMADGSRLRELDSEDLVVGAVDSGSGFCVSPSGYIVSNAHVVEVDASDEIDYRGDLIVRVPIIDVVFSGTSRRYRAKIVSLLASGDDDFAILKIEPFPSMTHIAGFTIDRAPPVAGASVRLFGFPLGKKLIQDRDVMSASIFMGNVSRRIDAYFQVQSAVYPGNSGGPVVDTEGNVIGIVTAVQTIDGGQIASDIGFVLPIERLAKIWPPTAVQ